jgi:HAD superfamily hydrolase (TIGR01484 family)
MIPFAEFPNQMLGPIRGVFTDIDDTLTTDGKLSASAYTSMELLQKNGILVIPITGRPAGWCDSIARIWPVDAVVGENGAFYFRYDSQTRQMIRHFVDSEKDREDNKARLRLIAREILTKVKGSGISADQAYRETDLAIDFCEDVSRLPRESIEKIVEIMSG